MLWSTFNYSNKTKGKYNIKKLFINISYEPFTVANYINYFFTTSGELLNDVIYTIHTILIYWLKSIKLLINYH